MNQTPSNEELQSLFDRVSILIRDTPVTSENSVSDDTKLRLYGLYKRVTVGKLHGDGDDGKNRQRPSIWNIVERYKFDSWNSYSDFDQDEAIMEYVRVAAEEENEVGRACSTLLENFTAKARSHRCQKQRHHGTENGVEDGGINGNGNGGNDDVDNMSQITTAEDSKDEAGGTVAVTPKVEPTKLSLPPHVPCYIEKYLGIQPFLPRGQLDISYRDLFHAFWQSIKPMSLPFMEAPMRASYRLESSISTTWKNTIVHQKNMKNQNDSMDLVVGLSVRSLLDLLLSTKSYPPGSEIIITPPINIQGMIQIMRYHDLTIVPIDIPKSDSENKDPVIGVDLDAVRAAITELTVAVMVVHPFGLVCTSDEEMEALQDLVAREEDMGGGSKRKIDILEDCSECFNGGSSSLVKSSDGEMHCNRHYAGSRYADVNFFSFGTIKTATALGGGIAVFRGDEKEKVGVVDVEVRESIKKMRRLQHTLYGQQSRSEYLTKVIKAGILLFVSQHAFLCGAIIMILDYFGFDYDSLVTSAVKGFNTKVTGSSTDDTDRQKIETRNLILKIRRRPSTALLSTLFRRIQQLEISKGVVSLRVQRCVKMGTLLDKHYPKLRRPIGPTGSQHFFWLYPIIVSDPETTSRSMKGSNFDVPRGASQLGCVTSFLNQNKDEACPRAKHMMDHILYLPIASQDLPEKEIKKLVHALLVSTSVRNLQSLHRNGKHAYFIAVLISGGLLLDVFSFQLLMPFLATYIMWLPQFFINFIAPMSLLMMSIVLILLHILRVTIGPYYINSSNTFAKYSPMLSQDGLNSKSETPHIPPALEGNDVELVTSTDIHCQLEDILNMDMLQVPDLRNTTKSNTERDTNVVLLSGATGFIGSLLLRDLLLHRERLLIGGGIVVICRSKRKKSASSRIDALLSKPIFAFLSDQDKKDMVTVIESDLQLPNLGMTKKSIDFICNEINVTHVINCAGCVSFIEPLEIAATSNITSALQLQALTRKLKNKDALYVYTSTAFVHGGETGSSESPLTDDLYSLGQHDPAELYTSMIETQVYASTVMRDLRFPNTYVFSKCVCEHLLCRDKEVRTKIIRPCIVGPSVQQPFEGWAGDKPSTLVAAACLYLKYQFNLWSFGKERASVIPVDIVTRFMIAKCFQSPIVNRTPSCHGDIDNILSDDSCSSAVDEGCRGDVDNALSEDSSVFVGDEGVTGRETFSIHTAAWDTSSPESSGFLWYDYAFAIIQIGSVKGHIDRAVAYVGLIVAFKIFLAINVTYNTFRVLHKSFVTAPIAFLIGMCDKIGWKPASLRNLEKLMPFLDLPLLFFPFTTLSFHFQTELVAPTSMNGERYMFNCALSAERFVTAINSRLSNKAIKTNQDTTNLPNDCSKFQIIAGRNHVSKSCDIWWAMTQPRGNYVIRLIGLIVTKLLRKITTEVSVDLASFAHTERAIEEIMLQNGNKQPCVVLVPTHRSLLDFIILSFVTFALPEMGLKIPHIAAADDFSRIPVLGWLARAAGAFFLKRGKGVADPSLQLQLKSLKEENHPLCVEVFLEGRRSRDRRFVSPKTGFLKCLCDTGSDHVIVPITINYEAVPDQTGLSCDIGGSTNRKLSLSLLFQWLKKVWNGKVQIGKVHLSAATPLLMKPGSKLTATPLARAIQQLQQSKICVSNYHLKVGASVLNIDPTTMQEALSILKCPLWPITDCTGTVKSLRFPDLIGERWSIFLHYGHHFAPFLTESHPKWASWLKTGPVGFNLKEFKGVDSIGIIVTSLIRNFDAADKAVHETLTWLQEKGFSIPEFDHILQYALKLNQDVPPLLVAAAVRLRPNLTSNRIISAIGSSRPIKPLFQEDESVAKTASIESFGAWGYKDSKFIARVCHNGTKCVTMKGARYQISGKQLPRLIPFLERETGLEVNPLHVALPQAHNNMNLCNTELSLDDFEKLYEVFENDKSRLSILSIDRARHGTGHSQEDMYMIRSGRLSETRIPDVVVFPKNEHEVEVLVFLANKEKWCLIPFGGGTNVSHATHCPSKKDDPRPMISVDMKLMNQILKVNEEDATAHVQAGIKGIDLAQHMESLGFTIGHEPDSIEFSTLGGWIATKASGMKQNKYGNIENIVKEVRVVGADGVLWQNQGGDSPSFGRVSTGIDLSSLVLGSEGSFGIITSAVIKIWPLPEVKEYESIILHEFDDGVRLVRDIAKMGAMKPASVRLLDNQQFRLGQAIKPTDRMAQMKKKLMGVLGNFFTNAFDPNNIVCVTISFEGTAAEVKLQKILVKEIARKHGGLCAGSEIGKAGYDMTYAIAYLRDFAMTYGFLGDSFETFVPWSSLMAMITATKESIEREHRQRALPGTPLVSCRVTQLYDEGACVYFYFCMNFTNVQNPSRVFDEIETAARRVMMKNGGSLSHHHGVGKIRAPFMDTVNPTNMKKVCTALKNAFDPENVFGANNGTYYSKQ